MKIVMVSFSTQPVMQKYLYLAQSELSDLGHDAFTVGSSTLTIDTPTDSRNFLLQTPDSARASVRSTLRMRGSIASAVAHIEEIQPDIVHFVNKHVWNYPVLHALRRKLRHTKFLHTFHDPVGHHGDSVQRGVIMYHRLIQRLLDGVIVHSATAHSQTARSLRPKCGIFDAPLGVTSWREAEPQDRPADGYALIFGRLNNYKGCTLYPEILSSAQTIDSSVRFVIAGNPAPDLDQRLLEEIRRFPNVKLEDRFIEEAEVEGLFAGASVVLMPYTSMTQSGVLLEAYSRAVPVVAFAIDGMENFVPDPVSLVPTFDTRAFADAAIAHVRAPEMASERGRSGCDFARERFTPRAMAVAFDRTYAAVARTRHSISSSGKSHHDENG